MHDGDKNCIASDCSFEIIRINAAYRIDWQVRNLGSETGKEWKWFKNRRMLDTRGDEVVSLRI